MKPILATELALLATQLPDPANYKWKSINLAPDVRFHKTPSGDGWICNNQVVVDAQYIQIATEAQVKVLAPAEPEESGKGKKQGDESK